MDYDEFVQLSSKNMHYWCNDFGGVKTRARGKVKCGSFGTKCTPLRRRPAERERKERGSRPTDASP